MRESSISIAGIDISFLSDEDVSVPCLGKYTNQRKSNDRVNFRVHSGPLPEIKPEEIIFDSGQTWALFRSEGKYVLQDDTLAFNSSPDIYVVLEPDFKSGDIFTWHEPFDEKGSVEPLGYPLNQILMILFMSRNRGILFHACGIDDAGRGYLFLGHSGHGKTTMAKLWSKDQGLLLNDDRIIVREKDDRFLMYGTPWHGCQAEWSTKGVPVHKIFFLNRDGENSVVPKKGIEAVTMLMTRSFPPLWDQNSMTYTINLCQRLVDRIPCHELRFARDKRIVDFIRGM